ncbi:MAG: DUF4375 domain-containing protein [Achromobacter ruhlandii]|jgi:Domain of unknown function (DUF4375)/Protein of unknown function (DUF2442)|nr:DUF4375 domain-containing protein [Achromobacter ruhlandii]MCI1836121.1 DUF4375 domain-containing protein [Achromobacter ruhlandii]
MSADYSIRHLALTETHILLTLADGRTLREPIRRHIRLEKASPAEREQWQLVDDDHGVVWPALLAPSAAGMLNVRDLLWDAHYEGALAALRAVEWKLESLPQREQELVALWRMEADINNGGFMQFLCNWGDPTCQLALLALGKIGAARTRAILADMRGLVDRFEAAPEVIELNDIYGAMTEAEQARLHALDEAYFDYPDDLARLGLAYYD